MEIHLIVAIAKENRGIGLNNDLLWHLPADMAFFKKTTMGYPIITGRKNYESIPKKFRPLPNRENIILTRAMNYQAEGAFVVHDIKKAIEKAKGFNKEKCYVIGGGEIYRAFLEQNYVDVLLITEVEGDFKADTFFPNISSNKWEIIREEEKAPDDKNKYPMRFIKYQKKQ